MTELPRGWRVASIGEIAEVNPKKRVLPPDTVVSFVPMPRVEEVSGRIDLSETISAAEGKRRNLTYFEDGDVIFAKITPCMENGKIALAEGLTGGASFGSTEFHVLRPSDNVDARYLRYFLVHDDFRAEAERSMTGAVGQRRVPKTFLADHPIPLPPLDEQQRIVAILEDHLSRLDAAEACLRRVQARSPLLADAVRDRAFSGALVAGGSQVRGEEVRERLLAIRRGLYPTSAKRGRPQPVPPVGSVLPVPSHWASMSLEEITDPVRTISYGILKPGPNLPDGVPYVRVVNMRGDRLDLAGLHRTSSTIASQYERASLAANDVLVSIRGTYGRVVLVPEELSGGNITQDTARLAVIPGVDPRFVREYLLSRAVQRHLHVVARGVAVKGVNIADLRQVPIGIPPIDEQVAIMDALDDALSLSTTAAEAVYISQRRSGALRRSLLAAAFSGQLTKETSLV